MSRMDLRQRVTLASSCVDTSLSSIATQACSREIKRRDIVRTNYIRRVFIQLKNHIKYSADEEGAYSLKPRDLICYVGRGTAPTSLLRSILGGVGMRFRALKRKPKFNTSNTPSVEISIGVGFSIQSRHSESTGI